VHVNSSAKLAMQLGHAGRKASTQRMWEGMDEPLPDDNWPIISASPLPYFPYSQVPKEMTRADMDEVKYDFVRAAQMSNDVGFDLLELHSPTGICSRASSRPLTNTRTDAYGGLAREPDAVSARVCSTPCAARGPMTSRCRYAFRRSTGHLGGWSRPIRSRVGAAAQGAFVRHHGRLRRPDRGRREGRSMAANFRRPLPIGFATRWGSRRWPSQHLVRIRT